MIVVGNGRDDKSDNGVYYMSIYVREGENMYITLTTTTFYYTTILLLLSTITITISMQLRTHALCIMYYVLRITITIM